MRFRGFNVHEVQVHGFRLGFRSRSSVQLRTAVPSRIRAEAADRDRTRSNRRTHEPLTSEPMNPRTSGQPRKSFAKSGSTATRGDWTRRCIKLAGIESGAAADGRRRRGGRAAAEAQRQVRERRGPEAVSLARATQRRRDRAGRAREAGPCRRPAACIQRAVRGRFGRVGDRLMFLPIVNYADGYGLHLRRPRQHDGPARRRRTAVGAADVGRHAPRRARGRPHVQDAGRSPASNRASAIWQRENPRFEIDDQRVEWHGPRRARLRARRPRRVATLAQHVELRRHSTTTCGRWAPTPALDTRADPNFPRNAVYLGAGWTGTAHPQRAGPHQSLHRPTPAATCGLFGQIVAAGRVAIHRRVDARCRSTSGCCSAAHRRCAASAPAPSTATACSSRPRKCACRSPRS